MLHPPQQFEHLFRAAGWTGERRCNPEPDITPAHPAYPIIESFNGLHIKTEMVGQPGLGDTDIEFQLFTSFSPSAAKWMGILNVLFIGVAIFNLTYEHLWVSHDGRFFSSNDISEHFLYIADNCDDAINSILTFGDKQELLDSGSPLIPGDVRFYDWKNYSATE